MKRIAILLLVLVPVAQTFCAEQLAIGMFSIRHAESDADRLGFSTTGLDFAYWNFLGNDKPFFGLTAGISSGDEQICSSIGCVNIDLTERTVGVQIGYDIDLGLTPFVTLNYLSTEIESSISVALGDIEGEGSTSDTEDDTSFDIGTWFGDPGQRIQFALEGLATDVQVISVGMYRALSNGVTLAGFIKTPRDDLVSSWKVSIGVGWSF